MAELCTPQSRVPNTNPVTICRLKKSYEPPLCLLIKAKIVARTTYSQRFQKWEAILVSGTMCAVRYDAVDPAAHILTNIAICTDKNVYLHRYMSYFWLTHPTLPPSISVRNVAHTQRHIRDDNDTYDDTLRNTRRYQNIERLKSIKFIIFLGNIWVVKQYNYEMSCWLPVPDQ